MDVGQSGRWNLWWAPACLAPVIMLALCTGFSRHLAGKGVGWDGASVNFFGGRFYHQICSEIQIKSFPIPCYTNLVLFVPAWVGLRGAQCVEIPERIEILFLWHNPQLDQWFSEWPMRTISLFRADRFGIDRTKKENMSWIWRWQSLKLKPKWTPRA